MPLYTVEGIYKHGKVELTERPTQVEDPARVLVTFLPPGDIPEKSRGDQIQDLGKLRQSAFEQMKEGIHLGGPPYPRREELHDRFDG
jgi:hypothetical protein